MIRILLVDDHPVVRQGIRSILCAPVRNGKGETIGERIPTRIKELVADGALGRKSGRGFHTY